MALIPIVIGLMFAFNKIMINIVEFLLAVTSLNALMVLFSRENRRLVRFPVDHPGL